MWQNLQKMISKERGGEEQEEEEEEEEEIQAWTEHFCNSSPDGVPSI